MSLFVPYRVLRRAALGAFCVWIVLAAVVVTTALLPLEPWARIPPESVSRTTIGAETERFSFSLESGGGFRCPMRAVLDRDTLQQTGVDFSSCTIPAKTMAGVVHEVAAALVLPALSVFLFLLFWALNRRRPKWWPINLFITSVCVALIGMNWWQPLEIGVTVEAGIPQEIVPSETLSSRLTRSLLTVGLGGLVGVFATMSVDWILRAIGETVERQLAEQKRHERRRKRAKVHR